MSYMNVSTIHFYCALSTRGTRVHGTLFQISTLPEVQTLRAGTNGLKVCPEQTDPRAYCVQSFGTYCCIVLFCSCMMRLSRRFEEGTLNQTRKSSKHKQKINKNLSSGQADNRRYSSQIYTILLYLDYILHFEVPLFFESCFFTSEKIHYCFLVDSRIHQCHQIHIVRLFVDIHKQEPPLFVGLIPLLIQHKNTTHTDTQRQQTPQQGNLNSPRLVRRGRERRATKREGVPSFVRALAMVKHGKGGSGSGARTTAAAAAAARRAGGEKKGGMNNKTCSVQQPKRRRGAPQTFSSKLFRILQGAEQKKSSPVGWCLDGELEQRRLGYLVCPWKAPVVPSVRVRVVCGISYFVQKVVNFVFLLQYSRNTMCWLFRPAPRQKV